MHVVQHSRHSPQSAANAIALSSVASLAETGLGGTEGDSSRSLRG